MYENTNCRVRGYGEDDHAFATKTGVRQGGILSPCLFNIAIDHVLKKVLDDNPIGITIYPSERPITDLTFADDIAVLAESMDSMQIMIDHIIRIAASVGLKLNCQKSKYMTANTDPINPNSSLTIENEPMEQVTSFTYLGSNIALLGSVNEEVQTRIQRASSIFAALKYFWNRRDIRIKTKTRIYCAIVRATLLYASKTWPLKADQQKRMEIFDHRTKTHSQNPLVWLHPKWTGPWTLRPKVTPVLSAYATSLEMDRACLTYAK